MASAFAKAAAATTPSKSKSKTQSISRPDLKEAIEQWKTAYQNKKNAEVQLEISESQILPIAETERVKLSQNMGECQSSIKINDEILVSQSSRYCNIGPDVLPKLEEIFGEDSKKYFKSKMKIEFSEAALADEDLLNKIAAVVGPDNLEKFFKITPYVEVMDTFHRDRATDPKVGEKYKKAEAEGLCRSYKAAIKIN